MVRRSHLGGMYEAYSSPLLPWRPYLRRQLLHVLCGMALILVSLAAGTLGFHTLASQHWIDAFLNASMLLGGMGPVGTFESDTGKVFAALFALYAGLVFLISAAVLLAPALHRLLHSLHMETTQEEKEP